MIEIRRYSEGDEGKLLGLLKREGDDWECYWGEGNYKRYKKALSSSVTYTAYEGECLCGYIRCRDDDGFGIYIYDLLVDRSCRGRSIGRSLMEKVLEDHPQSTVYVMSDVDGYYEKLGYKREGAIFSVKKGSKG